MTNEMTYLLTQYLQNFCCTCSSCFSHERSLSDSFLKFSTLERKAFTKIFKLIINIHKLRTKLLCCKMFCTKWLYKYLSKILQTCMSSFTQEQRVAKQQSSEVMLMHSISQWNTRVWLLPLRTNKTNNMIKWTGLVKPGFPLSCPK